MNRVTTNRDPRERADMGDAVAANAPVGRVGTAEDMAAAAIFLAGRSGDYVVGEMLVVDGGVVHVGLGPEVERTGASKLQQRNKGG
jgi:NAD(P)-dependent dehydrogenase (short-subunit alcohol dehydrogenase family)